MVAHGDNLRGGEFGELIDGGLQFLEGDMRARAELYDIQFTAGTHIEQEESVAAPLFFKQLGGRTFGIIVGGAWRKFRAAAGRLFRSILIRKQVVAYHGLAFRVDESVS